MNYDGEKTRTEAPASVEYNFTLTDFDLGCKSIIMMARISINFRVFPLGQNKQMGETNGGRHGTRTHDPRVANAVLSQLS
jgi:hypothetical protein